MRVLVCGGRDYADRAMVDAVLDRMHVENPITLIIEGRCYKGGADLLAQRWAERNGVPNRGFPMDRKLGRAGGPIRNGQMLREGRPDKVVSFPGGRGTANMVAQANLAGVPVTIAPVRLGSAG